MKVPISKRLLCCASFVAAGARVADIGTDHGYLGIYLLRQGIADFVVASDLREMPLQKARENAALFGTADKMEFILSDGLQKIDGSKVDTIVCAGMGGDLICLILAACPWICDSRYRLILQPQSAGQELRKFLTEHGFGIEAETLCRDGGFLYTVMQVRYGKKQTLTPGQQYVSPQLLSSGSELLPDYLTRIEAALQKTVLSLQNAAQIPAEKQQYYFCAWQEVREMRKSKLK